jgi:hypothetical protein
MSAPRCATCRNGIRWVSLSAGYRHLVPSSCPDSLSDCDQTQEPEELLSAARSGIEAAGHQVAAQIQGQPADLHAALSHLADALDAVAFLENWDQPPDPCLHSIWHVMARRWDQERAR